MKTFTFTVELSGAGDTAEQAWLDAVAALGADPGDPLTCICADDNAAPLTVVCAAKSPVGEDTSKPLPSAIGALRKIVQVYTKEYGALTDLPVNRDHWSAADHMAVIAAVAMNTLLEG